MEDRGTPDVGANLRTWRQQRGLSIRALAELCDISPNTISLIERGITSPSVATLHQLATALQVPIASLFRRQGEATRVISSRPGERSFSGNADVLLENLGSGVEGQLLEPFLVTLQPGADSGRQVMVHRGHEFVYCLQGLLEYEIEGRAFRLAAGESLLFEAPLPHRWRNPGSEAAVFLLIFQSSRRGESVEHHLQP
jgi:transcriptional regulator with XRE-family HTH domain